MGDMGNMGTWDIGAMNQASMPLCPHAPMSPLPLCPPAPMSPCPYVPMPLCPHAPCADALS
jgi:hypothetical protein